MTYDVDSGWPAPSFRISLGQIEDQGSAGFTLTDPNGTRHALVQTGSYNYDTVDGTFIHYYSASGWGGNYVWIAYAGTSGAGPKIASITDTLQRHIYFYYASNGDLIAITAPGMSGTSSDLSAGRNDKLQL
jgi:hypothetical protein